MSIQSRMLPDSMVVNGQLLGMRQLDAYNPITYGPILQGGTTPVPTTPPGSFGTLGGSVPQGSAAAPNLGVQAATASPWSPVASPLPWVVGALIIGLLGLRYIHWAG